MSSKTTFSLVFYINRSKEKKNGECPVMLRININGDKVSLRLKRFIDPERWDAARYQMKGRTEEARIFNDYIEAVKVRAHKKYNELLSFKEEVLAADLRDAILGTNTAKTRMLIESWEDHVEGLKKLIGKETTYATYQKYNTAKNHMRNFLLKYYKTDDVSLKAVDHYMITQYSMYLKTEMGCNYNTATKFLQNLKRITCLAIRHGWLLKDPFAGISLSMKEVDRPYLTEAELKKLMEFTSPFDRLNRVRDFFIFSCFTGLAYIDVKKLKRCEIEHSEGGYWIRTRRQKTGGRANIPLLNIPMEIIRKYCLLEALEPEDTVIPILSNQKINAYLKELADLCGISKSLSFHIARHTFATTVTMMNGVPIETVSKMLGHKNINSTQHYARIVDQKVGEDMELLSRKLGTRLTMAN
jgi:site-specific recombinase XerD